MPLHGEREPRRAHAATVRFGRGELDRLDDPVGRPRGGDQALAQTVDGLVVMGRNGKLTGQFRSPSTAASLLPGATLTGCDP